MSNVKGPDNAPDRNQRLEQLVDRYQEQVMRMCFLYLCDKTLAEDAMQETFLKVYRALDTFRGEASEKTWIMRIAIRTCYDMNHSGWFRVFNRQVTPDMVPETAVPFEESDDELMNAVIRLPIRLREVILLYYYQHMNVNETAESLGISQSSVSGRLKRGRERLKAMMEGSEFDE
ncbi:sigma-70 family RNA polymerase sigma factor [Aristaeella lactis]|uniref:RNA polymerase sigma-70 factor, ECF subfamily n=1 Tax=Aristaeella lactis TaxID=3046383 RepID=A0AC61PQ90_9FIRM|nr:sigma-70 family RNA polymerase sigma factor [Aristaeella lactis]QUA54316.1 sigma-70 family RNA polymerase sigma factor [Aristaeella lactis]SMC88639.1 RNA polymerase sigma-70 factor, ECF subfamily [Aristaeella lactis]